MAVTSETEPEAAAIKLRDLAIAKQSTDNVSVIVIHFPVDNENRTSPHPINNNHQNLNNNNNNVGSSNTTSVDSNNNNSKKNDNNSFVSEISQRKSVVVPQSGSEPSATSPVKEPSHTTNLFSLVSPVFFGITLVASICVAWYFNR